MDEGIDGARATGALRPFDSERARFKRGEATPRELLEQCIEVIDSTEGAVKAFVRLDLDAARRAADAATERYRNGRTLSEIDGCPIGVKDIIDTMDFPTEMGSRYFKGWQPRHDAACVQSLKLAGAVILGKTHTTEFACGDSAPTTNPIDHTRTPGGSSSGSAAAVGAGMVSAALGTQTVGSVLRPAAYCGGYGFKPSFGALPLGGIHPLCTDTDHLGVLGASLADVWAVAHVCGRDFGGSLEAPALRLPLLPPARRPARLARLNTEGWEEIDGETRTAFGEVLAALEDQGVEILDRLDSPLVERVEREIETAGDVAVGFVQAGLRYPTSLYREQDASLLGPIVLDYLDDGDSLSRDYYRLLLFRQAAMRQSIDALRGVVDGFITLSSSGPAPEGLGHTGSRSFLAPWSVIGGPSFSLPRCAVHGLPQGVQLMGFRGGDDQLASLAAWVDSNLVT